jgi:hypothetical protein
VIAVRCALGAVRCPKVSGSGQLMKSWLLGSVSVASMLVLLLQLLSGAPDSAGLVESINPLAAVRNLAFALGFGAGLPTNLAVIPAAGLLILIPVVTFLLTRRIARRFVDRERG